jgi:hypothetical protein
MACTGPRAWARRIRVVGEWLVPSIGLALMPKCPVCLAAYVALGTGIGISIATATYLRLALIGACVLSLSYVAWKQARRLLTRSIRN